MRDLFPLNQKYDFVDKQLNFVLPLQNVCASAKWQIYKVFKEICKDTNWSNFIIAVMWHGFQTAHPIWLKSDLLHPPLYWYVVPWEICGHPIMDHMRVTLCHIKIWSIRLWPFSAIRIARSIKSRLLALSQSHNRQVHWLVPMGTRMSSAIRFPHIRCIYRYLQLFLSIYKGNNRRNVIIWGSS